MTTNIRSLSKPRRLRIPFVIDVIRISDPDQIRNVEASGAVDRLHTYGTKSLPFWTKIFFRATRFYDSDRDLWFLSLESESPEVAQRRARLVAGIDEGYGPDDIQTIADLLRRKADDQTLARAITQIVNRRFFGREVPSSITNAARYTLHDFREMRRPWKYFRACASQKAIMSFCERTLGCDAHLVDIGHNIGEVVQTTSAALRMLSQDLETPVEQIFSQRALTPDVPRIATKRTRFGGLLRSPTVPRKTLLIFEIKKAAAETHDILFTFGAGRPERACVFKDFFLRFMNDLQTVLRDRTPKTPV